MTDSWDDYAAGWDDDQNVAKYADNAFRSLTSELDLNGLRIFDFGCGTGSLTERMAPLAREIVALDTSAKMISVLDAKNIGNVKTLSAALSPETLSDNPALRGGFDLVTASSVLAFVPDLESTLGLLKGLLSPTGVLVQWDWLAEASDSDFGFAPERLQLAYAKVGFSDIKICEPFSLVSQQGSMKVIMCIARMA